LNSKKEGILIGAFGVRKETFCRDGGLSKLFLQTAMQFFATGTRACIPLRSDEE